MKKALIIFNPTAGLKSKIDVEGMVRDKLASLNMLVDLFYLNADFESNIEDYNFNGVAMVVAVGGDGTVKVAAKTIIENSLSVPLAILPYGSANIIAVAAGIPNSIKNSLKLLEYPKQTTAIDVGLINSKHYFLVGLSIGYISKIVTGTTKDLKNKFGFLGYLFIFLFNRIKMRKIKFEIKTQNKTFWVKGHSLVIFNALNYYGLKAKKLISFTDGVFNLYVFTSKTFASLIQAFFMMFLSRSPSKYVLSLDNSYFKIILKRASNACQIDGDYVKLPRIIKVEVLPKSLHIIVHK
jgi:diacylglycerol kinase (ATP)